MIDKILILIWFILRPKFYLHFFSIIKRKFLFNHDTIVYRKKAEAWAAENAISYTEALKKLEINGETIGLDINTINDGKRLEKNSSVKMGGSGHIHLIYDCVKLLRAEKVIETGVAYGWSSLAILKAFYDIGSGKLCSVDMPYPRRNNEKEVGIVVPQYLRENWVLIRKPDKPGITEALKKLNGKIDICHYDSDKSWWGRHYAYPILWKSLKSNGLFISDDIQDNLYFSKFVSDKLSSFAVIKFKKKYVGLIRKT